MNKFNIVLLIIIAISAVAFSLFYQSYQTMKEDNERLKLNEKVYAKGMYCYKTKYKNIVAVNTSLNRTIDEFNNDNTNTVLKNKIKELNLKLKNINNVTQETTKIDTVLRDSIIYVKDCMSLKNEFIEVTLCKDSSRIVLDDSLYIFDTNRKEFINKRSNIFFIRWFQKKRNVVDITITHSNKLIKTKELKKQIIMK